MKYLIFILLIASLMIPDFALAYNLTTDGGLFETAVGTGHTHMEGVSGQTPAQLIGKIIKAILSFLGVVFLVLMILGGYRWMTAAGNEQTVDKAKSTITAAIIGMVIVLAAYAITAFIGGAVDTNVVQNCLEGGGSWEENRDGSGGQCVGAGS